MNGVIGCLLFEHDLRLVALAVLVCMVGSVATVEMFGRILTVRGPSRAGWIALAAVEYRGL